MTLETELSTCNLKDMMTKIIHRANESWYLTNLMDSQKHDIEEMILFSLLSLLMLWEILTLATKLEGPTCFLQGLSSTILKQVVGVCGCFLVCLFSSDDQNP